MNIGFENEKVEFKESLSQLDKGIKSLAAMLNRNNYGSVYFGVKDNGDVIGLTIGKRTKDEIRNRVRDLIDPRVVINIEELQVEDSHNENDKFLLVKAEGTDVPYSCDGRYYIRNVASDEIISNDLLRKMLTVSDSDLIKNMEAMDQDLTFKDFCSYMLSVGQHIVDNNEFLRSKGLYNKNNKYNLMAYLLSDQSNVSIKVVRFDGVNKTFMSHRTEYGNKCLLLSVNEVINYFNSINTTKVDLSNGIRKEEQLFNMEAFKEAWINACLHNSWCDMIPPSVFIYDDRIEIVSYGGLPYGLSLESFYKGLSKPVNLALLGIFNSVHFSEQSGHGVPKIVNAYSKDAFSFNDGTVCVTIKFAFEPDFVLFRKDKENTINKLNKNQRRVLEIIKDNPNKKLEEISDDLKLSLPGVKKIIAKLQNLDLIERIGGRKEGKWILK